MKQSYQKQLDKLAILNMNYKIQLNKVLDDIKNEYGYTPFDVDFDYFIDTFCVGSGTMTVDQINEGMKNKHLTEIK